MASRSNTDLAREGAAKGAPLAGDLARRFLRTQRPPLEARERAVLAGANEQRLTVCGKQIVRYAWTSDAAAQGPLVALVHGWNGYAGQLTGLVKPLLSRGCQVVAFDAVGHGASDGQESSIPLMAASLTAAIAEHDRPVALITHSIGSSVAGVAMCGGLHAQRVVSIAAASGPARWADLFAAGFGLQGAELACYHREIERLVGQPLQAMDLAAVAEGAHPPFLLVHDLDDSAVPVTHAQELSRMLRAPLQVVRGTGHNRILRSPRVLDLAADFACASQRSQPLLQRGEGADQVGTILEDADAGVTLEAPHSPGR